MFKQTNDTVVAVSTAPARGAIAVVRLTGPEAVKIADQVFRPISGKPLSSLKGYSAAYGEILSDGRVIDDGVATVFWAPKSYTGEDMAEISCHGNPLLASLLLQSCVKAGALPAGAGEFTKRAFLNGKMDLTRAEAVAELISAQGRGAARLALGKRTGALEQKIDQITQSLTNLAAKLAVWVDYPDDELMTVEHSEIFALASQAQSQLEALIKGYSQAVMIRQGVSAAIVGRPNVGKSTLMNLLCGSDRSIVSQYAGTTRDVVEGVIEVGSTTLKLLDTAGIRETSDPIEALGVDRARQQMEQADLIILVLDGTAQLDQQEEQTLRALTERVAVVVINKEDLGLDPALSAKVAMLLPDLVPYSEELDRGSPHPRLLLSLSALEGSGEQALRGAIELAIGLCGSADDRLISNQRQLSCVMRARESLVLLAEASQNHETLDALSILLDESLEPLWELVGKNASEAVITEVFSKFCVGK